MCALRILTGRPGAFLESRRQKPTTTKKISTYMIFLMILFGHRQHHNHPLSIEGGQLDFAPESKDFYTFAATIARSMSLSSSRVRSPVLYVITRFDKA